MITHDPKTRPRHDLMDLMQNYFILIRAHLRGLSFPNKKCSFKCVNNSVQLSSPQLLLSKRYSRLKLPFYNRFPMGDTQEYPRGYPP